MLRNLCRSPSRVPFAAAIALAALALTPSCKRKAEPDNRESSPWRSIGQRQRDLFRLAVIGSVKGRVSLQFVAYDAEAAHFAVELEALLRSCGFDVYEAREVRTAGRVPPLVLIIRDRDNPPGHAGALRAGFEALSQTPTGEVRPDIPLTDVRIMVGPRG